MVKCILLIVQGADMKIDFDPFSTINAQRHPRIYPQIAETSQLNLETRKPRFRPQLPFPFVAFWFPDYSLFGVFGAFLLSCVPD